MQQTRYLSFGSYRAGSGANTITSHAYTSQRENMDIGLYYYNGRYYAPTLARFISADTLVPDPANPQASNRYTYVLNAPTNYTDPSGHSECGIGQYHCEGDPGYTSDSSDMEVTEAWQRRNALMNNLLAWPASIASRATIVKQVQGIAPISQGPLNQIQLLPNGAFYRVPSSLANASSMGSYGLPVISGAINQVEIHERLENGDLSSNEATKETINNGVFTAGSSFLGGYGIPKLVGLGATTPGPGWMTLGTVALAYDLNVAQGTVNNMIEGQEFGTAFFNAREATNDRFSFGHGQELENFLNRGADVVANSIIWAMQTTRGN